MFAALTPDAPTPATVEEALGITPRRSFEVQMIMEEAMAGKRKVAEALDAFAKHPDLTDAERVYAGYKLAERVYGKGSLRKMITRAFVPGA